MSAMIPDLRLRVINPDDKGWVIYEYRGATIRSQGVHNRLLMDGHPMHQRFGGHVDLLQSWVDAWIDHQRLPPPLVWPPRK
ncbi:hypothetical protein BKE38_12600 [Pseudoroseomonas deserti]|uniref:Uncharacterized protein n=1 Tax=Teichococcus deserti TaxID=1817963 RepID=A0A1V2H1U9_9PROT|nr:hypothetical protein [Pseudoroseomonas deserti]ONG53295.1 hypothetical protein BKE38_12600 [Pseudoroseomonas deserti]